MKLAWSKDDKPEHSLPREMARNCGQLLGRLDELLPCLYIAQYGASGRDLRERETQTAPGMFAVGARTGGDRPGVAPRVGLILPLRLCRDEKARAALGEIPVLIDGTKNTTMSDRRRAVQAKLDDAFGGELTCHKAGQYLQIITELDELICLVHSAWFAGFIQDDVKSSMERKWRRKAIGVAAEIKGITNRAFKAHNSKAADQEQEGEPGLTNGPKDADADGADSAVSTAKPKR